MTTKFISQRLGNQQIIAATDIECSQPTWKDAIKILFGGRYNPKVTASDEVPVIDPEVYFANGNEVQGHLQRAKRKQDPGVRAKGVQPQGRRSTPPGYRPVS